MSFVSIRAVRCGILAQATFQKLVPTTHVCGKNILLSKALSQDTTYIEIPVYTAKEWENLEEKRARLVYQSRKRGIKETDLVLSTFAHKYLDGMTESELAEYDKLINVPSNDWDIYYWASGVEETPEEFDGPIMRKLIEHTQNKEKESRFQQPDLTFTNTT